MIEVGTKIIGNFGGYTEMWNGEIVTIETHVVGPTTSEVKVVWDNGSHTWMVESEINSAIGKLSPIGYYTEEAYYAS